MFKKLFYILICLMLATSSFAETTNFYISKDGDNTTGLTWVNAWTDLQSRVQTSTPSNIYNISNGVWQMTNLYLQVRTNTTLRGIDEEGVIIQAANTNRVIYVFGTGVTLDSLTIRGGTNLIASQNGGGIYGNTDTIVTNCTIVSNRTTGTGGGIYRSGLLVDSTVEYNSSSASEGGGLYGVSLISNCVIRYNTSQGQAGGIRGGSLVVDSDIIGNQSIAGYSGGARYANFINCNIVSNSSGGNNSGGGAYLDGGYYATNCYVAYNTAYAGAGFSGGNVFNCLIEYNQARYQGGGLNGSIASNCTVRYNIANDSGGGLRGGSAYYSSFTDNFATNYSGSISAPSIVDGCYIANNTSKNQNGGIDNVSGIYNSVIISNKGPANVPQALNYVKDVINCTIIGHTGTIACVSLQNSTYKAYNNILYRNSINIPSGSTNLDYNYIGLNPSFVAGTYKLSDTSACIDGGINSYAIGTTDAYGKARTNNFIVDIGASEWYDESDYYNKENVYFVAKYGNNLNSGTSWESPWRSLAWALTNRLAGDILYVGAGIWTNTSPLTYPYGGEISSFYIPDGVTLAGTNATSVFLDGQYLNRTLVMGSNSILNKIIVQSGSDTVGANVVSYTNSLISYSMIRGGTNALVGGGVSGPSIIYSSTISNNHSALFGGGIVTSTIYNTLVANNISSNGGGIYKVSSQHSTISNNFAYNGGGSYDGTDKYSTYIENIATNGGGGYNCNFDNCNISGNTAGNGGGLYISKTTNCVIISNTAVNGGGAFGTTNYNSYIYGNIATVEGGGTHSSVNTNSYIYDNRAYKGGGVSGGKTYSSYITNNTAVIGGGAGGNFGDLIRSFVMFNSASRNGGASAEMNAYTCVIVSNVAPTNPAFYNHGNAYNCTIVGHSNDTALATEYDASYKFVNNLMWSNTSNIFTWTATNALNNSTNDARFLYVEDYRNRLNLWGYNISQFSPCLDTGTNMFLATNVVFDIYGQIRRNGAIIDIGAAERNPTNHLTHWYFTKTGNDSNDGLTWATARTNLQKAANTLGVVRENILNIGAGDWMMTNRYIQLENNYYIKGTNRDLVYLKGTTTSCVINVTGTNCWLDSITVASGSNRYTSTAGNGGGINGGNQNLIITNCNIVSNWSIGWGGGIYGGNVWNSIIQNNAASYAGGWINYDNARQSINNSTCRYNSVSAIGGGMYGQPNYSSISNCLVEYNIANNGGGVAYNSIYDSMIRYNYASNNGGGYYQSAQPYVVITNSTFLCNTSKNGFGGVYISTGSWDIKGCKIIRNESTNSSVGGLYVSGNAGVYNTLIASNKAKTSVGGIQTEENSGLPKIINCILDGNIAPSNSCCYIHQTPAFYNCTILNHAGADAIKIIGSGNFSLYERGGMINCITTNNIDIISQAITFLNHWDWNPQFSTNSTNLYMLASNSPVIGKSDTNYVYTATDFYGRPRTNSRGTVSLGAVEYWEGDDE